MCSAIVASVPISFVSISAMSSASVSGDGAVVDPSQPSAGSTA